MNEKVKKFLDAKKAAERAKYEEEKNKTLIELGLYEKEYSPDNSYNAMYSFSEWSEKEQCNRYYKPVVAEVTDEEYEEIKKYANKGVLSGINVISQALTIIAWIIYVGGFIAGLALGNVEVLKGVYYTYTDTEFSFSVAFSYWSSALISGTVFLGFAEIINLLEDIKNKKN